MRVLMLGWELPPHNSGGLGVACWQLCKELAENNTSIRFIIPFESDYDCDFMDVHSAADFSPGQYRNAYDSKDFFNGSRDRSYSSLFEVEDAYVGAIEEIAKDNFDVIHAHDWLTFRAALKARDISGRPLIAHVHSVESDRAGNNPGNPLVHEIEALGLANADHIVAVSEATKRKIINEYKIPHEKITVAHNSIDPTMMAPIDEENVYRYLESMKVKGYKIVVNVGRLTIQKGLTHFLRAAQMVVEKRPNTLFLIVGSGDQEHELIRLSSELGIGKNVLFAGFQRGKAWRDAFAVADFFVLPSVAEPFGLTPLEAAAYRTPSLISNQSGVAEVLKNCLKVDSWDEIAMANNIVSFLREEPLAQSLGENVYQEFARMNWSETASKLQNIYRHHAERVPA